MSFFCYFQGALYVLLNNRMLFLIVHYWEVMVDVWPVIVQVRILMLKHFSKQHKSQPRLPQVGNWRGKIKIRQGHRGVREFCLEWGKIDILSKSRENWTETTSIQYHWKLSGRNILGHYDYDFNNAFFSAKKANLLKTYQSCINGEKHSCKGRRRPLL